MHEGGCAPLPRGPPVAPPTSTPTLYIHVRGEKNQREGFIAFYDTEPPLPASWERGSPDLPACGPRRGYASRPVRPIFVNNAFKTLTRGQAS